MITVENLSLEKAQRPLLRDISWQLESGQMLGVIGPNGAGKSSLLRCLAGLWRPSDGGLLMDAQNIAKWSRSQRASKVAWLGQQNAVAFDFSVQQVVALGLQALDHEAVDAAMNMFGVQQFTARGINELSGGQQQRVHLARVYAQLNSSKATGQLLLLDEPLNGLDLRWQQRCLSVARSWVQNQPAAHAILALHDIGLAATVCDQVLVLNEGMIEYFGPPAGITESLLEKVWCYPLSIQREHNQTLVYAKAEG